MRRDGKNLKKEKLILMTSSALVLGVLTLTGIYVRQNNLESKKEEYEAKLSGLEEDTEQILDDAAGKKLGSMTDKNSLNALYEYDYDMDYMPMESDDGYTEAGSNVIEIGKSAADNAGNTDGSGAAAGNNTSDWTNVSTNQVENEAQDVEIIENLDLGGEEIEDITATVEQPEDVLIFEEKLVRPVNGDVLIPYNMNGYEYFKTLNHYQYNPAQIISAAKGEDVAACADGRVKEIYKDARLGQVLVLELGGGYEATYGQLSEIAVEVDDYVSAGQIIAKVENPTRFYSMEGSNLYFMLTADKEPVNPEAFYAAAQ